MLGARAPPEYFQLSRSNWSFSSTGAPMLAWRSLISVASRLQSSQMNTSGSGPGVPLNRTCPQKEHRDAVSVTTPASRLAHDPVVRVSERDGAHYRLTGLAVPMVVTSTRWVGDAVGRARVRSTIDRCVDGHLVLGQSSGRVVHPHEEHPVLLARLRPHRTGTSERHRRSNAGRSTCLRHWCG